MVEPETRIFKLRKKLPTAHYAEIGRIITRFAQIEMQLRVLTYRVLGVGEKPGRLAVNQFRAGDQITLIKDLTQLRGLKMNVDWGSLKKRLKELESFRDRLSHCIWMKDPDSKIPIIQDFSTAYIPGLPPGTRPKITPLAVSVPLKKLQDIRKGGDIVSESLLELEVVILKSISS